ncbi:GNAT family N-acetyltransferase [Bacillus luteus]|uniref:GNAT family N-acetyltransferase n=1 Tax=Alkalicoccus luteus TaxID=1237094 RepID=A0A969PWL4_9BACI|nr:GNAT family N-acetyltransferase [Alkalicoccus luteus]
MALKHRKKYHSITHTGKENRQFQIAGPLSTDTIEQAEFDEGLKAFRQPEQQKKALIDVSKLEESRIIAAIENNKIVGYAVYLYPDEMERWSQYRFDNLIELGAIEVSMDYRGHNLAKEILKVSMMDDAVEDYIIITTEYYWHWDLRGTGLSIWDYRDIMEKVMKSGGLMWYATDDPEITSHPANCLMARVGSRVSTESVHEFDRVRFQNRYMI